MQELLTREERDRLAERLLPGEKILWQGKSRCGWWRRAAKEPGAPANFLDVGGTATKERVMEAFKVILEDPNVKCIMVNIFGGIVRCDMIAEGIRGAVEQIKISVPVVVRLEGNQAHVGEKILNECGLNVVSARDLRQAATLAVQAAKAEQDLK